MYYSTRYKVTFVESLGFIVIVDIQMSRLLLDRNDAYITSAFIVRDVAEIVDAAFVKSVA